MLSAPLMTSLIRTSPHATSCSYTIRPRCCCRRSCGCCYLTTTATPRRCRCACSSATSSATSTASTRSSRWRTASAIAASRSCSISRPVSRPTSRAVVSSAAGCSPQRSRSVWACTRATRRSPRRSRGEGRPCRRRAPSCVRDQRTLCSTRCASPVPSVSARVGMAMSTSRTWSTPCCSCTACRRRCAPSDGTLIAC